MSRWRGAAIERLPEFRSLIASSGGLMRLWIELRMKFVDAYREPRNDDLIRRIYSYADWCMSAPRGKNAATDPATAVVLAFYEHIPQTPAARQDMPRWFTWEDVSTMKATFSRFIEPEEFEEMLTHLRRSGPAHHGKPKRRVR